MLSRTVRDCQFRRYLEHPCCARGCAVIPSGVAARFFLVPFSGTPGHAAEESALALTRVACRVPQKQAP